MNVNVGKTFFVESKPEQGPPRFEVAKVLGRVAHGVAAFVNGIRAARTVEHLATRYYAMSDSQLANVGLTREQIPAELIRVLTREQSSV